MNELCFVCARQLAFNKGFLTKERCLLGFNLSNQAFPRDATENC